MAGVNNSKLKGLPGVLRKLNKAIKQQRLATKRGLYTASLIVKADSVKNTSIDLGNLRGSAFVMVTGLAPDKVTASFKGEDSDILTKGFLQSQSEGKNIVGNSDSYLVGIVAYSAYYALYVHEMPSSYTFNQGENKFLEKALMANKKRILNTLIKYAKV